MKRSIQPRKPLRRTAWGLFIGGLVGTALQLSVGVLAVSQGGTPAGPGQEATWPAGQTMTLARTPGEINTDAARTARCLVTEDGKQRKEGFTVGEPAEPVARADVKITCDQPLSLLTGTPKTVAEYARGPLICIPLLVTFLGILFFFPRFTFFWARSRFGDSMMRAMKLPPFDR